MAVMNYSRFNLSIYLRSHACEQMHMARYIGVGVVNKQITLRALYCKIKNLSKCPHNRANAVGTASIGSIVVVHFVQYAKQSVYKWIFVHELKSNRPPELNAGPNVQNFTFLFPNFTKKKRNIKSMFRTFNAHTCHKVCLSNQLPSIHFNSNDYGYMRGKLETKQIVYF